MVAFVPIPEPYDFVASTERFRAYGRDLATAWVEGALYRVVDGTEVRVERVAGGVEVQPGEPAAVARVSFLLGLPFDVAGFWAWANAEPVLRKLARPLAGYRPPLQPDSWEAVVTSVTAQQVSLQSAFAVRARLVERLGRRHGHAWAFPRRDEVARASEEDLLAAGFSRRKAEYVLGLARSDLDLAGMAALPDAEVVALLSAQRGLGRWSADWFLARALARPDAWPAGDLGLRKAVSHFYGDGRMLEEAVVREVGERFGPWRNLAAHMLLAGLRVSG
jgi:DNA-3-methyladenine glycosylase II